jgi:hypothetical protein
MKVLVVFLLVFCLQFPAFACPLPPEYELAPVEPFDCSNYPGSDGGCQPVTNLGWVGSWKECLKQNSTLIYRVYYVRETFWNYGHISFSLYHIFGVDAINGQRLINEPLRGNNGQDTGNMQFFFSRATLPPEIGSFINPEMECWCPPPPCLFPQCIVEEISEKFPFDIFLNIPATAINCPSLTFFGQLYDLCWLYELLRWFKYPIAISLLIKLAMHL